MSGVDETRYRVKSPASLVEALAAAKATHVASLARTADALVIGCDSMLVLDGEALGKPGTPAAAIARWRRMRGNAGTLMTGHCVIDTATARRASAVASTTVHFADISDAEIDAYVATGEPLDVAGAFTIDGYGGAFVTAVQGDSSNVLGISLPLLRTMTAQIGVPWVSLWRR